MTKLKSILNSIGDFFYNNWFLIPALICLYGLTASYHTAQRILNINIFLWILIGSLLKGSLREKDEEIENNRIQINKLFLSIEEIKRGVENSKKLNKKEYPTLVKYHPEKIWEAVKKLQTKYPDMTEEQCLLNLEMDLAQIEQMS